MALLDGILGSGMRRGVGMSPITMALLNSKRFRSVGGHGVPYSH